VGGGITGAGVAREASRRGLRVALLEADDFAAGTSSRSSKLIHGGLRYLALGEVALVRETALERKRVHHLAPHLAEPCWMLVPARSRAGLLKFRAGIGTYERLGAVEPADRHQSWSGRELAEREPLLRRDRTPYACVYREYLTDDARLVLANLRAAARRGAQVLSRAPVEALLAEAGRAAGVVARCAHSGRRVEVRARGVVNAAGPWVEAVRRLEDPAAPSVLHLSKGVHVVLPRERVPVRQIVILPTDDRRSIFAIPRGEVVYVGTTDTSYDGAARLWPAVERADVEYLLAPLPRTFDVEPVRAEECLGAWSGLRPLVAQPGRPPAEISRRDEIWIGPGAVVSVAGGKLTGYAKMAEDVLARAGEVLGALPPAPEDDEPLPGGDFAGGLDALAARLAAQATSAGLGERAAARLARLYGSEAAEVVASGPEPLATGAPVAAGEVDWAVTREGASALEDVLYRRTRAALFLPAEAPALVEPAAARMAGLLGWSAERTRDEVRSVRERLAADRAFAASPAAPWPAARKEAR
jgi:glycerol-3-phosphate dehydrogenase